MPRADWLIGQAFETRFVVISIANDSDQTVTLEMHGGRYEIALEELLTVIERGFVVPATENEAS